jgi:hypothetical protein
MSPEPITEPTTAPSTAFADFILAQIRCAALRSKITCNQLEAAATALSAGMISPEMALLILHETGAAGLIPTSSEF